MRWSLDYRQCTTYSGALTVHSVSFNGPEISAIDLSFVQHCDGAMPALHGSLHWTK